jgi:sialate O-acetylesterase
MKLIRIQKISISILFYLLTWNQLNAAVKLPSIFANNMVLQQGKKISIWGRALPGEKIAVKFINQEITTETKADGRWSAKLKPVKAGGPFVMQISSSNTIVLKNILVGEVWLCSGQSNMELSVEKAANAETEIANANFPNIRLFIVKHSISDSVLDDCEGSWVECNPKSIEIFSAVGYYFGRSLHKDLKTPVGLIQSTWGGTAAETWVSKELLLSDSDYQPILDRWKEDLIKYPNAIKEFEKNLAKLTEEWNLKAEKAKKEGLREPRKPQKPRGPGSQHTPSGLFNAMINPLIPYTIQGVIWYQGEANAKRASQYKKLFPALISEWRAKWGLGNFPFYYVQLPNLYTEPEPSKTGWPELREAQLMTLNLPNTGMAVTIDIGEAQNLHPLNKQDVGSRLALIAKAKVYHKKGVVFSGPIYQSMTIKGNKILLKFIYIDGGLITKNENRLQGFTLAGGDRKFYPASAKIQSSSVIVWCDSVKNPVSVRYAWSDNPDCNLYNKAMLPASPFRTDTWNGITFGEK